MTTESMTPKERDFLLTLARETIERAARIPSHDAEPVLGPPPTERLKEPGASFVTLHTKTGALRGCIGSLIARRSLVDDVHANALAAAFHDPRFPAVTPPELPNLVVEVSVLSHPEPLEYDGPKDLLEKLRPEVDGVVLRKGMHRATFLPQVWEQLPDARTFLSHLCQKAGLPPNAWEAGDLDISTYQVEKFEESH
jgi:AmmeMemoRadiSam system protein A